jgi:hypothetical protein
MTKRTLYAVAGFGVSGMSIASRAASASAAALAAVLSAAPLAGAGAAQQAICGTCLAISVAEEAAAALPPQLDGLDVLVRVSPGREDPALEALNQIENKGGRPGLSLEGFADAIPPAALLGRARRVLAFSPPLPPEQGADASVFELKTRLTAIRANMSGAATLGLAADTPTLSMLMSRDLASYLDFVVSIDPTPLSVAGLESWRIIPGTPASAREALEFTRTAGATQWLWVLPPDPVLTTARSAELTRLVALPAGVDPAQPAAPDRFAADIDVVGSRSLTVEEIVARHQAAATRQAALVRSIIATGTLTLSFEAPGFPAPITIGSETTIFTIDGVTEIEQRAIRINGIEFRGSAVPRLPIIEPERVASPPLAITLTDIYRYRLAGRETVGGTLCYVVAFEPDPARGSKGTALFRGRAWIAADSFAMLKVAAAQTGLRGAIVASEQVDEFGQAAPGVWVLVRSEVRQMYEGAAHRTPIHRVLAIAANEINPPDFVTRRQSAYSSGSVMLRDTPEGYRYLKKDSDGGTATPEIAGRADRVRAIAAGVIIDPNISVPLPFAGISYVDFNFLNTGTQVNAFFGGTYGQFAFSVPSIAGSRWQFAGRGYGIASSYNDRSFVDGREQYQDNIRQRPAQLSIWLLRPVTPRISIRAGYDLDYTHLTAGDVTAPDFVVPADQIVHGARLAIDVQRFGWNGTVWWNPARRAGWRAWGRPGSGEYRPSGADFQRYGLSLTRSTVLTTRLVARVEGAWMSGHDLDRFSRYSFGTFDNRLRGYPSALIRYDRGAVLRTALAWSAGRLIRIDGFLDYAAVHDPGFGRRLRNYTGFGTALEAPAPFGTLIAIEWGYGARGVNSDGRLGTQVLRVNAYKVF